MAKLTVSEIAHRICAVDGLSLADHSSAYWRVRNIVRAGYLEGGEPLNPRGTLAFPADELCRARILTTLASLSLDLTFAAPMVRDAAANSRPAMLPSDWPERTKVDGGRIWRGFADIVAGVTVGEAWTLRISHYAPGNGHDQRTVAAFILEDAASSLFGSEPLATITLDLATLFAGLIDGAPQ